MSTTAGPPPSLTGFTFNQILGRGTSGTVYKATRKTDNGPPEIVAVKCIRKSSLSKVACENIITEITILKELKHEYIVALLDFDYDENYIYLVFEYCPGGDLSNLIRHKRRIPQGVVQHFVQQIAAAMKTLRDRNVSHMDLKPKNILLSQPIGRSYIGMKLKLADFGLAQYLKTEDTGNSIRGSPLYMAPEILLHQKYDAKVDLWSIGIIMYECLYGKAPFASCDFVELAEKIKSGEPILYPVDCRVSKTCQNLLVRLLQRDPEKRISFESFFRHPFIDLEHIPSTESYNKGVALINLAVADDNAGNYAEAFENYMEALEYLIPFYTWRGKDMEDAKKLREKIVKYMERAEQLKNVLKMPNLTSEDIQQLEEAYEIAKEAEELCESFFVREALNKYTAALEQAMAILSKMKGKHKELLREDIQKWIEKAEYLKQEKQQRRRPTARRNIEPTRIAPLLRRRSLINESHSPTCYVQ